MSTVELPSGTVTKNNQEKTTMDRWLSFDTLIGKSNRRITVNADGIVAVSEFPMGAIVYLISGETLIVAQTASEVLAKIEALT